MILHWNILLLIKIISILMDSSVLFPFLLTLKFTHISYNFIIRIMGNTAIYWTFWTWSSQHYISLYQLDSQGDHLTIWQSFQVLRGVLLNNQISTLLLWLFDMNYSSFPRLVTYSTSSIQFSSVTQSCLTLCDPMNHSMPGFPVHHQLPEFTQTHVHCVRDAIQTSHPLPPLLLLPSIFPTIRIFSNESALHIRWLKYWSVSFNISPSNEYSGLISFRMDWLDFLAVQGTLKSFLQHHSSKA